MSRPSRRRTCSAALRVDHLTIVCYVRRPDRYLESWYNQLVKMGLPVARLSPSMMREPRPRHRYYGTPHTDFDRMIEYWAHQVGCDELIVRDYDHLHNGAIFDDFSAAVGLPSIRRRRGPSEPGRTDGSTTTSSSTSGSGRCSSRVRTTAVAPPPRADGRGTQSAAPVRRLRLEPSCPAPSAHLRDARERTARQAGRAAETGTSTTSTRCSPCPTAPSRTSRRSGSGRRTSTSPFERPDFVTRR